MKKLVLTKGRSFSMKGFSCVNGKPFDVEDEAAEYLLGTGKFEEKESIVAEQEQETDIFGESGEDADGSESGETDNAPEESAVAEQTLSADAIGKMKTSELEELALSKGIDISGCKNNKERAEKICGILGLASTVQMGLEQ